MRKLFLLLICILLLPSCNNEVIDSNSISIENQDKSQNWLNYTISFEGVANTTDNPWGFTAGLIEEDHNSCVFLTPNTSFVIEDMSVNDVVSLLVSIHPWVAQSSDGAGVDVWFLNDNDDILLTESFSVPNDETWLNVQYRLDSVEGATKIRFLCNNGQQDDDSADWVVFKSSEINNFANNDYIKSATYFANAWPINFWNSEFDTINNDFNQIASDGFNSIIIVVPWKEFQICTSPIIYSDYTFDKLDYLMQKANEHQLSVYARIGYSWDYYNDTNESITERFLNILRDAETHDAWLDYCTTMYDKLSTYSNFKGGFLTWEDFWGCLAICDNEDESIRLSYSKEIGYQDYIQQLFSLDSFNATFNTCYNSFSDIPIPKRNGDPCMELFYQFYDDYLYSLLIETQGVFPNISLEVRLDWDLYTATDGTPAYYEHSKTYKCGSSDFTATMYAIPMGCENVGEKLTADEALGHTEYILSNLLNQNGRKAVYIEQFLFMDNTPQFSYNAQIREEEQGLYLEQVADILRDYSQGYGIWTYRDYKNNMIYNSQFALQERGWEISKEVSFDISSKNNSTVCYLNSGSYIYQAIPIIRDHFPNYEYTFSFEIIDVINKGDITISLGNQSKTFSITDTGQYSFVLDRPSSFDLTIQCESGQYVIDNLELYSFIQRGKLYDENNNVGSCLHSIQILNKNLEN